MTEIILLIVGGIIFILSFLIPGKGEGTRLSDEAARDQARILMEQELDAVRGQVEEAAEEAASDAMEKTERTLERLSNEKIMAVNEYSDTVLAQIHKDHEEAMFLYDMLNNKQVSLKNMMAELNQTVKAAEEVVGNLQKWTAGGEDEVLEKTIADTLADVGREVLEGQVAGITTETQFSEAPAWEEAKEPLPREDAGGENYKENYNEEILALYRQGKSEVAIARELGLGVGVVQLVCNLYKER